ncbi:MAG: single-stranded DNA-binding protein [Elusimicrobiales bacterium]|nr:single-stranded DNA-binding protein [Elusimicrobiales bacterium]
MDIRIPEINQVMIAGRLTRDPELRFTQKQQGVVSLSIAVNRRYQDPASGEWKDDTTFVPVTVWGPAAERCKDKMKKGSPVLVEGRLTASEYTDKTGQKRKEMKITARRVQLMAYGEQGGAEGAAKGEAEEPAADAEAKSDASGIEEVPF